MDAETRLAGSRRRWFAANATVFLSSFCVMVIELVAGRVVSRHLGASLYTWTSVIGVILAGLAFGNYVGGRLADRFPPRRALSVLFGISSATCVAITIANNLVAGWSPLWELAWPTRVAIHVGLVFLLPAALLGTIGPIVASMALGLGRETGRTLGGIYAWGVTGSIVGTFASGYFLISVMGTSSIIWTVAAILAATGVLYVPRSTASWGWLGAVVVGSFLALSPAAWAQGVGTRLSLREALDPDVLYRDESRYSHIEVRRLSQSADVRGLFLDKLMHSEISLDQPLTLRYGYSEIFAALTRCRSRPGSTLHTLTIGGGGYVFPRYLEAHWPGSRIDVVEIDPAVTRAAFAAFGLPETTTIRTFHEDGRVFVNRLARRRAGGEPSPAYDFIYVDAVNDYAVPYQLTSVEFFGNLRGLLAADGVLMINMIDVPASGLLLGALAETVGEVFARVDVFGLGHARQISPDSRVTFVMTGSAARLDCAAPLTPSGLASMHRMTDADLASHRAAVGHLVLDDSYAPVENLMAPVVLASSRDRAATAAVARAIRADRDGDPGGFIEYCRRALELDPEHPAAHYNLAVGLHREGDSDGAIAHWRRAIRAQPDYVAAHYNLGAVYFQHGELGLAERHLSEAVRIEPNSSASQEALGVVLEAAGDLIGAERRFARAVALAPDRREARQHLARVRERLAVAADLPGIRGEFAPLGDRP